VSVALGGWLRSQPAEPQNIDECKCGCASCETAQVEVPVEIATSTGATANDDLIGITNAFGDLLMDAWRQIIDRVQPAIKTFTEHVTPYFAEMTKSVSTTLEAHIPPQRVAQFHAAVEVAKQSSEGALRKGWAIAEVSAQALHAKLSGPVASAIQAFVDRHPEHQRVLADRDPIAIVGALVVGTLVALYEFYCLWSLMWLLVRRALVAPSYLFCCSRRRAATCATSKQVEQSSEERSELEQSSTCVAEHEGPPEETLQIKAIAGGA